MRRLVRRKKIRRVRPSQIHQNPSHEESEIDRILCELGEAETIPEREATADEKDLRVWATSRYGRKTKTLNRAEGRSEFTRVYQAFLNGIYKGEKKGPLSMTAELFNWGFNRNATPLEVQSFLDAMKNPGYAGQTPVQPIAAEVAAVTAAVGKGGTIAQATAEIRRPKVQESTPSREEIFADSDDEAEIEVEEADEEIEFADSDYGTDLQGGQIHDETPVDETADAMSYMLGRTEEGTGTPRTPPETETETETEEQRLAREMKESPEEERSDAEQETVARILRAAARSRMFEARYLQRDDKVKARYAGYQQFLSPTRHKPLPSVEQLWNALEAETGLASTPTDVDQNAWLSVLGKTPNLDRNGDLITHGTYDDDRKLVKDGLWKYFTAGYGGNNKATATGTLILLVRNDSNQSTQLLVPSSTPVISRGDLYRRVKDTEFPNQKYWAPAAEFVSRPDLKLFIRNNLTTADVLLASPLNVNLKTGQNKKAPESMWKAIQTGKTDSLQQMLTFIKQTWRILKSFRAQQRMLLPIIIFQETGSNRWIYRTTLIPKGVSRAKEDMDRILGGIEDNPQAHLNPRRRRIAPPRKKRLIRRVKRR